MLEKANFMERLQDYLKGELQREAAAEFLQEVGSNERLNAVFEREKSFADLMRVRLTRQVSASPSIAQNIRRKIGQDRNNEHLPPRLQG